MAFEAITKNQIEKLLSPALKCVDMVSTEVMSIIKSTADGVRGRGRRERIRCSITVLSKIA